MFAVIFDLEGQLDCTLHATEAEAKAEAARLSEKYAAERANYSAAVAVQEMTLPPLLESAPAMLEALRSIMDGGSWQDDGSFVYYPPTDAPEDGGAIDDASAILARIDGAPTTQPAGAIGEAGAGEG